MISNKITTLVTSQEQPCYTWHHLVEHAAGETVTVPVRFPKHKTFEGFPTSYSAFVTPDQPAAVSVTDKDQAGFTVTLTSLSATPLMKGKIMMMVIG